MNDSEVHENLSKPSSSRLENEIQSDLEAEKELTNKFLSGEMSFTDYSLEWYNKDDDEDDDNYDVDQDEESNEDSTFSVVLKNSVLNKNRIIKRRKCTRLSPNLQGLMGEANLRCARGETEIAEKMCYEIIRQVPRAPEPYQTLALIYENDAEKSLQFSLFAAHLSPSDADEWMRLANISKQREDTRQEMLCLTQAVRARPESLEIHMRRLDLIHSLEQSGCSLPNMKISSVKCYHKIVTSLPPTEGVVIMDFAKKSAKLYYDDLEYERALQVMKVAYQKCSSLFQLEDINLYLELLMSQKEYQECIGVFVASVGVEIEAEVQTVSVSGIIEEHTNYINCQIPSNVPIDLRSKLLICLVHLKAIELFQMLLQDFLQNDVEKAPDLYMDIEEALTSVGQFELALKLLEPLIQCDSFDLGAVWLKHAECLYNLNKPNEAIDSYLKVIKHAPQHIHARQRVFKILEEKGNIDGALNILQQDYKLVVSAQLLYDHCLALKKYNRTLKYLEVGEALLSKTFVKFKHEAELKIVRMTRTSLDLIHNFRSACGDNIYHPDDLHFDEEEAFKLTSSEEWNLLKELLKIAFEYKKYYVMQRLSFGALMSKNLNSHRLDIDFFCLQSSILNKDFKNAFPFVRDLLFKYPHKIPVWNLFNFVAYECQNYGKFLSRIFQKDEQLEFKHLFFGNNYLNSGRYLVALKNFLNYHEVHKDSLTALLIGITLLVMAAQRTVDKHHNLILQGFAYLFTYQKLRKWDHESYYNFGRACQMLNLNNLAIEYYERSLSCACTIQCEKHGHIDLTRETAFNLYVLYKDHSPNIARMYLQKYLVI